MDPLLDIIKVQTKSITELSNIIDTLKEQLNATNDRITDTVTNTLELIMKLKEQIYKIKFDTLKDRVKKNEQPIELVWSRDSLTTPNHPTA